MDSARWIRCNADKLALESDKYRFNVMRATYTVFWIERYCTLYEGEAIGSPLRLCSYFPEEPDWWESIPTHRDKPVFLSQDPTVDLDFYCRAFNADELTVLELYYRSRQWAETRAEWHLQRVESGEHVDWQYEGVMQVFGWETTTPHPKHKRLLRRFRSGSYWVSKKNKKSPTLAAIGLYLLDGDGESGAKVYLAAADGGQARRIAGSHTLAMVEQSPYLNFRSKINKNEMSVSVKATRSKLEPLSSNNSQTIKAKEGLNGSALIDETHVVDGRFMATIDRLGISRSEPLVLEFSTAGDNPDGYGFKRWEYGEANNESGEDLTHYHLSYHVPQNLTGAELAKDPIKYAKMANAAWGHTVDPDEWLADYHKSKVSPSKLHDFLKYRCNQWQRTSARFISSDNWEKCSHPELTYANFKGGGGGIGLDGSRVDDFFAVVAVQRQGDEGAKVWPIVYVPETRVESLSIEVPEVLDWAAAGYIKVTAGKVVNQDVIKSDLLDIIAHLGTKTLIGDETFVSEFMEYVDKKTRVTVAKFIQGLSTYSSPTDDFERMTIEGTLWHPNNPAFTWQAYNTHIKEFGGKRRPIKDPNNPHRKIDAIQAAIMGLKAMQMSPDNADFSYARRGVVVA